MKYIIAWLASFTLPILMLLRLVGIQYYIVRKDNEKTRAITKALQKTTTNTINMFQCGNFYPSGYFANWRCVGFYNYIDACDGISAEIHIVTTCYYFNTLFNTENTSLSFTNEPAKFTPRTLTIYSRTGSYTSMYYSRLHIDVNDLEPRGQQRDVLDSICEDFAKKRRGVYFIHGVSCAGKSTIGLLVGNRLNGSVCHTFNPTDPGDTIQSILRDSEPSSTSPTIIIIEEANTLIRNIHEGIIQKHKNITTCIYNKSTYNTFMDDLILYKNVMFIFTSNENKAAIDALDPCYLRKGRVSGYYSMMDALDL